MDVLPYLYLLGITIAWWCALKAVFRKRLGGLHFLGVALAGYAVPVVVCDALIMQPLMATYVVSLWILVGVTVATAGWVMWHPSRERPLFPICLRDENRRNSDSQGKSRSNAL